MPGQYTHVSDCFVRKVIDSAHLVLLGRWGSPAVPSSLLQATRLGCCQMIRAMVLVGYHCRLSFSQIEGTGTFCSYIVSTEWVLL